MKRWCFEVRIEGRLLVRGWGRERRGEDDPARLLDTWLEYRTEDWGLRQAPTRTFAQLRADAALRPLCYGTFDEFGCLLSTIDFREGGARALSADGTVLEAELGNADFLVAANCLPHLAAKVEDLLGANGLPYRGALFAPETLEAVPYELEHGEGGLRSSLGEELVVADGRLVALRRLDVGLEALACRRPTPRWPALAPDGAPIARPPIARSLAYRPPAGVQLEEGSVVSRAGSVIGYTVAAPRERNISAFALFIGGSGGHDRHGLAGGLDLGYHELLDGLTRSGLASLRFDKRGSGTTPAGEALADYGFEGILDDAGRCLAVARSRARRMGVPLLAIGHSEGGLVALVLASRAELDGLILLATAARPVDRLLVEQIRARGNESGLSEAVVEGQVAEFEDFIRAVRDVDAIDWERGRVADRVLAQRSLALYYRQLLRYDPLRLMSSVDIPVLVVHGEHDLQVPVADAEGLVLAGRKARKPAELAVVQGANHLLKSSSDPPSIGDYFDRRRKVMRPVFEIITSWLDRLDQAAVPGFSRPTG